MCVCVCVFKCVCECVCLSVCLSVCLLSVFLYLRPVSFRVLESVCYREIEKERKKEERDSKENDMK
jgi:hypothetical protein